MTARDERASNARATPLEIPGDRCVLPKNRWDLLDGRTPAQPPRVSVIVPHFDAQPQLDRLLLALAGQSHPMDRLEVIVADDGSAVPPTANAPAGLSVRVVRQPDLGFRAAAARNLGAAAATGDVLCFLDVDTVPEPGYLQALTRLPALAPDALVTGRRRHADLAALSEAQFLGWLAGGQPVPRELAEPRWLRDRHDQSGNLLALAADSYRFVLSAVLACARSLFVEIGGFDASIVGYGGEDWEFAHRALCAGALLAHVPDAVAWHDGPSWEERGDAESRRLAKNAETIALERRVPALSGRPWTGRPDVVVEIDGEGEEPAAVAVAVRSVLAGRIDAGIWLNAPPAAVEMFAGDPRIAAGPPPAGAVASARTRARLSRPLRVAAGAWPRLLAMVAPDGVGQLVVDTGDGVLTVSASRAIGRADRWDGCLGPTDLLAELFGRAHPDAAAVGVTPVDRRPELAREVARMGRADQP